MHYAKTPQCDKFYSQTMPRASLAVVREDGYGIARKRHCADLSHRDGNPYGASTLMRDVLHPEGNQLSFPTGDHNMETEDAPAVFEDEGASPLGFYDALFHNDDENHDTATFETDHVAYSSDQQCLIELMKILIDMNAPDYAFAQLLTWACKAHENGFSFQPEWGCSRNSNMRWMFNMTNNARLRLPYIIPVPLENNRVVEVVAFEFVSTLLTKLQDRSIMKKTNLNIDWENPFAKYVPPDGCLGEAISGSAYRQLYDTYITDPTRQLCLPMITWSDRGEVSGNNRFSLAPVMFTLGIFTEVFRHSFDAWAVLGYMPDLRLSSAERAKLAKGEAMRGYHAKLSAIFESYLTADDRLKNVTIPIGPTGSITCDLVVVFLYSIQDMDEGDKMCGRYKGHNKGIQRHCRACDIPFNEMDNPEAKCRFVTAGEIRRVASSGNEELQKRYSIHQHINAFDRVPMADPIYGIHGATPSEPMHCVRKGIIERVANLVINNVPKGQRQLLDVIASQFHRSHRQTYRAMYPSTNFGKGITNLTKISANEYVGLLFLFVIISHYDDGWTILDQCIKKRGYSSLPEVLELIEALLCFDAWLKKPKQWHLSREKEAMEAAQNSIRVLMQMCVSRLPRMKGNGWCLPKFHELLHIVWNMMKYGAAPNFMAERTEALMKDTAKYPGRRAQKRHHGVLFEQQSARRLAETAMVNALHQRIVEPELYNNDPLAAGESNDEETMSDEDSDDGQGLETIFESTGRGTFGTLRTHVVRGVQKYQLSWCTKSNVDTMGLPVPLLAYLYSAFGSEVRICTEYVRENLIFRCHPNYQDGGPIFDWMRIRFQNEEGEAIPTDDESGGEDPDRDWVCYPSRLACVVVSEHVDQDGHVSEDYELVVQCATRKTGIKSALFTEWEWSPEYYRVETDSIDSPCFVVSIKPDNSLILETLALEKWCDEFTPSYATPAS